MTSEAETIECDVAVIGAGPGGSVAAALLARRGVRVVLLDKDTFPREKLCGDFVSYDAAPVLEHLGMWDEFRRAGGVAIDRARIVAGRTARMFPMPERSVALSRYRLDALLLDSATKAGAASMSGCTVESASFDGTAHRLEIREGTVRRALCAPVVVGAWGRWSRLDVTLGRAFTASNDRHIGLAQYGVSRRAEWADSVDLYAFRGGYLGVTEVEGNRVNLCGLVEPSFLQPFRGRVEEWLPHAQRGAPILAEEIAQASPLEQDVRVSSPVIFAPREIIVDHILTIGDAAVVLPPVVGGGIAGAVQTALLAADTALRLLARPHDRPMLERDYAGSVTQLLRRRRRWARLLGGLLSRPKFCEALLRVASPQSIWHMIVRQTRSDMETVERLMEKWSRQITV